MRRSEQVEPDRLQEQLVDGERHPGRLLGLAAGPTGGGGVGQVAKGNQRRQQPEGRGNRAARVVRDPPDQLLKRGGQIRAVGHAVHPW